MVKTSNDMYGRILLMFLPSLEVPRWVGKFANGMQRLCSLYYSDLTASINYKKAAIL